MKSPPQGSGTPAAPAAAQSDKAVTASTPASGQTERELVVEIWPRFRADWSGSAAQLQAEGLIPPDFAWPEPRCCRAWKSGLFSCEVARCRPPGTKGPMSQWVGGDYWCLSRGLTSESQHGTRAADIYEKTKALRSELLSHTPEGQAVRKRWCESIGDKRFQAVLALIGLKPAARTRRAAQQRSSTSHGESHE